MEDIETNNFIEIFQQMIENNSASIIDKVIPTPNKLEELQKYNVIYCPWG